MRFEKIDFTASYGKSTQLPDSVLPEIVFSGKSNVGKSSLINKVFNRKNLARVSSVPGKTITVNFFSGDNVNFVDLPGYGYARREQKEKIRWAELMEGYFKSGRNIVLVVQLLDFRHCPTDDDYMMLEFLESLGYHYIIAFTKCDKLNKSETETRRIQIADELKNYPNAITVEFSAVNGQGTDKIKKFIEEAVK